MVTDRRRPMDMKAVLRRGEIERALAAKAGLTPPTPRERSADEAELLEKVRERFEERWCDESVPALGGVTPRQAADDPSRRDALVRLIDSFEDDPGPTGRDHHAPRSPARNCSTSSASLR